METIQPFVIMLFGLPGSGKGTQADRLAECFLLHHLNSGSLIERTVHDGGRQQDPIIQRERALFDAGVLNSPDWVTELIVFEVRSWAAQGNGLIFSGSPRTLPEAEALIPVLEELYGKGRLIFLHIRVRPETSIFRNSHRRICEGCGKPLFYTPENVALPACPACGGHLVTRTLDAPDAIAVRIQQYEERTKPIFEFLEHCGHIITLVDGEPDPDSIAATIHEFVKSKLGGYECVS